LIAAAALALLAAVPALAEDRPAWEEPKASDLKAFMRAFSADIQNATNSKDEESKPNTVCYAMSEGRITSYCQTTWMRDGPVFTYTDQFLITSEGEVSYRMCNGLRGSDNPQHLRVCQNSRGRQTVESYDGEHWNVEMTRHTTWADYDNTPETK
jgi:hypothetical protein